MPAAAVPSTATVPAAATTVEATHSAATVEAAASHPTAAMGGLGGRGQRERRDSRSCDGTIPQNLHVPDQDNLRVRRLLAFTRHSNPPDITRVTRTGSVNSRDDTSKPLFGGEQIAKMNGAIRTPRHAIVKFVSNPYHSCTDYPSSRGRCRAALL
jgi:hypothetical protein